MGTHKDLDVWKKSMDLAEEVYRISKKLPRDEQYVLVPQMRRAAISIPNNIAEGSGRKGPKEFCHYLDIATASLVELESQLLLVKRLGYTEEIPLVSEVEAISKMLYRLKQSIRRQF